MDPNIGLYIAIAAALLFYLRLIILQRHKARQAPTPMRGKKDARQKAVPAPGGLQVRSWWLLGPGIALVVLGGFLNTSAALGPVLHTYWWVVLTAGIGVMGISIK